MVSLSKIKLMDTDFTSTHKEIGTNHKTMKAERTRDSSEDVSMDEEKSNSRTGISILAISKTAKDPVGEKWSMRI